MSWLPRWLFGDEEEAWERASRKNRRLSYRWFRYRFPSSIHAEEATRKIEEIDWTAANRTDTIEAHRHFLKVHPGGLYAERAKARIYQIEVEWQAIQDAVKQLFPRSVQVSVAFSEGRAGCAVRIVAHLLDACSPHSTDPVVRGAYGSHAGLYSYVKHRISQMYRTVFQSAPSLRFADVVVECKHGVRHVVVGGSGSGDYATTLYTARLDGKKAKSLDWSTISDEALAETWQVCYDIIPSTWFEYM